MYSEILKIIPKLDPGALAKMENSLSARFTKVAKKFGNGIANVFKGGGLLGVALGLIDKILNPLKEVQEALDRTLKSSDDISANAGQFNTTSGKLFKLIQLAKSTGLDQDSLFTLITKFQTAVAEAKANPNQYSAVKNYSNDTDTADSFFQFIQSLQKMDKTNQILVQQSVFGEKQILKMADFLQTDFAKQFKAVGLDQVGTGKLTNSIDHVAAMNGLAETLAAKSTTKDAITKAGIINEGMIRSRAAQEQQALDRENARLRSYQDLQAISISVEKIMTLVERGVMELGKLINWITPTINRLVTAVEGFAKGPMARGIMKWFGGDKGD